MPGHDIIVIGFSAGGVEAVALPNILRRSGELLAFHPKHKQRIEVGQIYVAAPQGVILMMEETDGRT